MIKHPIDHYLQQLAEKSRFYHLKGMPVEPFVVSDVCRATLSLNIDRLVTRNDLLIWLSVSPRTIVTLANLEGFPKPLGKKGRALVYSLAGVMSWWHRTFGTPAPIDRENAIKYVWVNWLEVSKIPNPPTQHYRKLLEEILLERPLSLREAAHRLGCTTTRTRSISGKSLYPVITEATTQGIRRISAGDVLVLKHRHLIAATEVACAS